MSPFVEALIKEIKMYQNEMHDIQSIYIGGGTPSLLDISSLEKIVEAINVSEFKEFTIEVNPESLTKEKLNAYKRLGINRISMGVQSSHNHQLKLLGRQHTFEEVIKKVEMIRTAGFDNLNLDLIYSLPGQTLNEIKEDIIAFIQLDPEHISTYSLSYDEGTIFDKMKNERLISPIDDDLDRDMFKLISDQLNVKGYERYEISNFSKEGFESRHNMLYWSANEYIGLGPSAHGYLNRIRYENVSNMKEYIQLVKNDKKPIADTTRILHEEALFEYIILNLRKTEGFSITKINRLFEIDFTLDYKKELKFLMDNRTIEIENDRVFLSDYGFDVSNSVFEQFIR